MQVRVPHNFESIELPTPDWLPMSRNIRELVACLLGQVYFRQQCYNKNANDAMNLSSIVLRDIFNPKISKKLIDYCIQHHLIIRDESYSTASHESMKYLWHSNIREKHTMDFELTDKFLVNNIKNHRDHKLEESLQDENVMLAWGMFEHITIDTENALSLMSDLEKDGTLDTRQREYAEISIREISEAKWRISREPNKGRVHSNFTNIKGKLRSFIKIDNSYVSCLDVKSMFPACVLLEIERSGAAQEECVTWCQWLCDDFYGELAGRICHSRNRTKTLFQVWLHERDRRKVEIEGIMHELFPEVSSIVSSWRVSKNAMHVRLSRIEAELMIDRVSPKLALLGIRHFTLHDAIYIPRESAEIAATILQGQISEMRLKTRLVLSK